MSSSNGRVQIAYLHGSRVSHSFMESMVRLVAWDAAGSGRVTETGGPFMIRCDTGGLVEGRNMAIARFLDETDHEWLWFVDTDMGFAPDTVDQLAAAADPAAAPVVGGLCFALRLVAGDGMGGHRVMPIPTLFKWAQTAEGHEGFANRLDYPADTLLQVAGTGAACLLLHRDALAKVRAQYGDTWCDPMRYGDGRPVSEDLSLCWRLATVEVPVHVHTGVKTTHHKELWVGELDYAEAVAKMSPAVAASSN